MIENQSTHNLHARDQLTDAALPGAVARMLRTACTALEGPDRDLDAVSVVARLPHGTAVTAVLAPIERLAREHGCRASIALAHGALEVRLVRGLHTVL